MSTYKDIIIDCFNNDKVIPPRIRLNIYNKILEKIIIGDENYELKYICIELIKILNDYNINVYNTNFYYKDINDEYIHKNYKICFPEFDRKLILKNTNLFYSIKHGGISWFNTMQDRITFIKLMIDLVNKKIEQENN